MDTPYLACLSCFFVFFITSPLPLPLPLSDTLTKLDGHAFFGMSVTFFSSSSSPYPFPSSSPFQTRFWASATYLFHYMRRTCQFQRVRCVLSRQTLRLHSLPTRTLTCPFGRIGGLRQILQLHSLPIRPPPGTNVPIWVRWWCSASCLPPQPLPPNRHGNAPHMAVFACLLPTFSPHLQCAHLGMLVFGPSPPFSSSPLLPFSSLTVIPILVISFSVILPI